MQDEENNSEKNRNNSFEIRDEHRLIVYFSMLAIASYCIAHPKRARYANKIKNTERTNGTDEQMKRRRNENDEMHTVDENRRDSIHGCVAPLQLHCRL